MADEPNSTTPTSTPEAGAPSPVPTPAPASQANGPPVGGTAPDTNPESPAGGSAPDVSRDTLLSDINPETGETEYFTIGQLIERHRTAGQGTTLDAERIGQLETYAKAIEENDSAALQAILGQMSDKLGGPKAPPEPGSPEAEIQALKDLNSQLTGKIEKHDHVFNQINQAQDLSTARGAIQQYAEHLPFLANFDQAQGAAIVLQNFNSLRGGRDVGSIPAQEKQMLFMRSLAATEQALEQVATAFGGQKPGANTNGRAQTVGNQTTLVDDQRQQSTSMAESPPQYTFVNGVMLDQQGRPVQQTAWNTFEPVGQPVPSVMPGNVPSSGAQPVMRQEVKPQGKFTLDQLRESMRQRRQQ